MLCILSKLELHGTSGKEIGKKLTALAYETQVLRKKYTEYSVVYRIKNIQLNIFSLASFIYIKKLGN